MKRQSTTIQSARPSSRANVRNVDEWIPVSSRHCSESRATRRLGARIAAQSFARGAARLHTIIVGIKRVVDYNVRVRVKPDGSGMATEGLKMSINPFDEIAIEAALRLKESGAFDARACS